MNCRTKLLLNSVTSTIGWTATNYLLTWEMSRNRWKKNIRQSRI